MTTEPTDERAEARRLIAQELTAPDRNVPSPKALLDEILDLRTAVEAYERTLREVREGAELQGGRVTTEPTDDPIAAVLDEFRKKVNAELMGKPLNQAIAEPMAKEIVLLRAAIGGARRFLDLMWRASDDDRIALLAEAEAILEATTKREAE